MNRHLSLDAPDVLLPNRVVPTRLPSIGDPWLPPTCCTTCPLCFSLSLSPPFLCFRQQLRHSQRELGESLTLTLTLVQGLHATVSLSLLVFFFFSPPGSELSCGGENSMACMAALVGASVAIGAPSAALSRSSASSVICSSSSSFNPVFLRNRSFHGTTVRLGATKPGLNFSSFVILCWESPAQMMMMALSSIILSMVAYCILRCSLVSNVPPTKKIRIP